MVPDGAFETWPPWLEQPWYGVTVFYLTTEKESRILYHPTWTSSWKMSLKLRWTLRFWIYWHFTMEISIPRNSQTALACTNWFLTLTWMHLLFVEDFFPSNTHSLPFQATAWSLIYSKNSPFFSISPLSFLCLLVTWLIPFKQFAGSEQVAGDVCLRSHEFKSPLSCKCCCLCSCITPLNVHHT